MGAAERECAARRFLRLLLEGVAGLGGLIVFTVETHKKRFLGEDATWHSDGFEWESHDMAQLYALLAYTGLSGCEWRIVEKSTTPRTGLPPAV